MSLRCSILSSSLLPLVCKTPDSGSYNNKVFPYERYNFREPRGMSLFGVFSFVLQGSQRVRLKRRRAALRAKPRRPALRILLPIKRALRRRPILNIRIVLLLS